MFFQLSCPCRLQECTLAPLKYLPLISDSDVPFDFSLDFSDNGFMCFSFPPTPVLLFALSSTCQAKSIFLQLESVFSRGRHGTLRKVPVEPFPTFSPTLANLNGFLSSCSLSGFRMLSFSNRDLSPTLNFYRHSGQPISSSAVRAPTSVLRKRPRAPLLLAVFVVGCRLFR